MNSNRGLDKVISAISVSAAFALDLILFFNRPHSSCASFKERIIHNYSIWWISKVTYTDLVIAFLETNDNDHTHHILISVVNIHRDSLVRLLPWCSNTFVLHLYSHVWVSENECPSIVRLAWTMCFSVHENTINSCDILLHENKKVCLMKMTAIINP